MQGFGNWATNDVEEKDGGGEVEAKLLLFVTLLLCFEFERFLRYLSNQLYEKIKFSKPRDRSLFGTTNEY